MSEINYEFVYRKGNIVIDEEVKYFLNYLENHHKDLLNKMINSDHYQFQIEDKNICICFDVHDHRDQNLFNLLDKLKVQRDKNRSKYPIIFSSAGECSGKIFVDNLTGKKRYYNQHTSANIYLENNEIIPNLQAMVDLLAYVAKLW